MGSKVAVWKLLGVAMLPVKRKPWVVTTIVKFAAAEVCWNWSVAVTVIWDDPVCVGVPESVPVLLANASPAGNVPVSLQVNGCCKLLPVAVRV